MTDERERIARLEADRDSMKELLEEMRDDIRQLRKDWTQARGLVAGVVLTVSAIWAVALAGWQFVKAKVGG